MLLWFSEGDDTARKVVVFNAGVPLNFPDTNGWNGYQASTLSCLQLPLIVYG